MAHLIPIPFLVVTVALLVRAELHKDKVQTYVFKPISTLLVIAIALLSFQTLGANTVYTLGITVGLLLSLGGDLSLMLDSRRAFTIGLVFFLLAHVAYTILFTVPNGFHSEDLITGALLLALGMGIYIYLRPGLGKMQIPVMIYVLAILIMVNRALSTFWGEAFSTTQAWLIAVGAILFMLSDLMLAVNRFRQPFKWNRFSLVLYYGGQLLIALSPSYFL